MQANEVLEYDVPTKKGKEKFYIINWAYSRAKEGMNEVFIRGKFNEYNKNTTNEKAEEIIKNTLNYIDFIRKNKYTLIP